MLFAYQPQEPVAAAARSGGGGGGGAFAAMASSSPLLQAHGGGEKGGAWWRRLIDVEEAKAQLLFAFPMILTNVSYYAITLISVMFAGHLGDVELAGATLGNSWGTVTGLALMVCLRAP
ncbi:hypothetical protein BHE74_00048568 [Ensete ventricosum]|nr:hypothetical protein BHE74_00048568 [Ensete ventricosum]